MCIYIYIERERDPGRRAARAASAAGLPQTLATPKWMRMISDPCISCCV